MVFISLWVLRVSGFQWDDTTNSKQAISSSSSSPLTNQTSRTENINNLNYESVKPSIRLKSVVGSSLTPKFLLKKPGNGRELGGGESTKAEPAKKNSPFICFGTISGSGPNRSVEERAKSSILGFEKLLPSDFFFAGVTFFTFRSPATSFSGNRVSAVVAVAFVTLRSVKSFKTVDKSSNGSPRFNIFTCPITSAFPAAVAGRSVTIVAGDLCLRRLVGGLRFRASDLVKLGLEVDKLGVDLGFRRDLTGERNKLSRLSLRQSLG
ncbi:hypothetical protein Hanom_Chr12g01133911 [Helianthus anomalus]